MRLACGGAHVLALQETRGCQEDLAEFIDLLPGWTALGSFLPGCASGGVVFLLAPALLARYTAHSILTIVPGRIALLRLRGEGMVPLDIANLHLVSTGRLPVATQVRRLAGALAPLCDAVTIVIGDTNVCSPGEGRLDLITGRVAVDTSPLVDMLGDTLESFHEIMAQGFSRVQLRDGRPQLLSRASTGCSQTPTPKLWLGDGPLHTTAWGSLTPLCRRTTRPWRLASWHPELLVGRRFHDGHSVIRSSPSAWPRRRRLSNRRVLLRWRPPDKLCMWHMLRFRRSGGAAKVHIPRRLRGKLIGSRRHARPGVEGIMKRFSEPSRNVLPSGSFSTTRLGTSGTRSARKK